MTRAIPGAWLGIIVPLTTFLVGLLVGFVWGAA